MGSAVDISATLGSSPRHALGYCPLLPQVFLCSLNLHSLADGAEVGGSMSLLRKLGPRCLHMLSLYGLSTAGRTWGQGVSLLSEILLKAGQGEKGTHSSLPRLT